MTPRKKPAAPQLADLQAQVQEALNRAGLADWSVADFTASYEFLLREWQEVALFLEQQGISHQDDQGKYLPQYRQVEKLVAQVRAEERHQAAMEARYGSHQRDEDAAALPPD